MSELIAATDSLLLSLTPLWEQTELDLQIRGGAMLCQGGGCLTGEVAGRLSRQKGCVLSLSPPFSLSLFSPLSLPDWPVSLHERRSFQLTKQQIWLSSIHMSVYS